MAYVASPAPDAPTREQLYKATNRLCIRIHGCSIDSLSHRRQDVIEQLYGFAEENWRRYQRDQGPQLQLRAS